MRAFIDLHRHVWGVEPFYGAEKVWRHLARDDASVAHWTVEHSMGLFSRMRGKAVRTTAGDSKAPSPLNRINRQFREERLYPLWVSELTYVAT